ncbi:hypothetical protein [Pseudacidovorax sp. RU35E]|jgi:hypothetical protein|uniref:hypothetical protein n=1 Tax=Pseudacidovorax sp. RU35E TaxID=1907403 RepID=UPI0009565710|nr:hypothetical protein [Pseudacidovorax sp. RU35E]SIQ10320.1 hypothetical protein SAMN05880557_10278 [Pseudacidovorax sp. RU35E]
MTDTAPHVPPDEAVQFEVVVDEILAHLRERSFFVSRITLRNSLLAYAAREGVTPLSGARVADELMRLHMASPAELLQLS